MTRVKMNAKHEYEFIANFKVMQNVFKSKRIEKARSPPLLHFFPIPKKTNDDNDVACLHTAHPCRKTGQMQNAVRSISPFVLFSVIARRV